MNKRINRYSAAESSLPGLLYTVFCFAIAAWLLSDGMGQPLVSFIPWADYWEHTAVLREWLENFAAPSNPHVDDPALSSRFMPYFWLLVVAGRAFGLNAIELMSASLVINFLLIAVGLKLFLSTYFRDRWAPLVGLFVVFGFWGIGWNWSNLFQLRSFFYVGGYPSAFAFGLGLISFWCTLRLLRSDGLQWLWAAVLLLLAAVTFLSHPLTGVFVLTGCALLAAFEPAAGRVAQVMTVLTLLSAAAVAELWPFFSVWKLVLGLYGPGLEGWSSLEAAADPLQRLSSGAWQHLFYDPELMISVLGLSLLGLPVLVWLALRGEHPFIVYGALLMALPYLLNFVVEIPLAHRFLLFFVAYLHFAIIWAWLEIIDAYNETPRSVFAAPALYLSIAVAVVVIIANVWLALIEFDGRTLSPLSRQIEDKRGATPDGMSVPELYTRLLEPLDESAVVLSTARAGWPVPTFRGRVVSLYHENPILEDQARRYAATADFFYRPVGDLRRVEIIQRFDVHHVLVDQAEKGLHESVMPWLASYGTELSAVGSYRLYALSPELHEIRLPEPEPEASPSRTVQPKRPPATGTRAPATAPQPAEPPAEPTPEPGAVPQAEEPRSFGAPIAPPVLDPARNGA